MKTLRVLPADVFDAMELSAWIHGGIGAHSFHDAFNRPLCATGHRWFLEAGDAIAVRDLGNAFFDADINAETSDPAVIAINKRSGNAPHARVPFDEWCAEMNVVRGA